MLGPHVVVPAASLGQADQLFSKVFPWLAALIGLVIIGSILITAIRRWHQSDAGGRSDAFTLHDLREMHRRGQLSDEEFERAKQAIISQVKRSTSENEDDAGGGTNGISAEREADPDRSN